MRFIDLKMVINYLNQRETILKTRLQDDASNKFIEGRLQEILDMQRHFSILNDEEGGE